MRVIGGFRRWFGQGLRHGRAADRWRARGRKGNRRLERGRWCLRLRGGIAAATGASGFALTARLAAAA
jgi:hypothetical protein